MEPNTDMEPNYIFVKGEGWVLDLGRRKYEFDNKGRKWLIKEVNREPLLGEYWDATSDWDNYTIRHTSLTGWNNYNPTSPNRYKLQQGEKFIILEPIDHDD